MSTMLPTKPCSQYGLYIRPSVFYLSLVCTKISTIIRIFIDTRTSVYRIYPLTTTLKTRDVTPRQPENLSTRITYPVRTGFSVTIPTRVWMNTKFRHEEETCTLSTQYNERSILPPLLYSMDFSRLRNNRGSHTCIAVFSQ